MKKNKTSVRSYYFQSFVLADRSRKMAMGLNQYASWPDLRLWFRAATVSAIYTDRFTNSK
jgi:hypothetical protein